MDSNRVDEMTERAAQSLAAGEPLRALALADQLVSINPEDATARVIRSHALMATHSVDEAFREAQVAVLFDAESEDAQMAFALAAWRSRKISLAQQAFERAVGLCRHRGPFEAQYAWFQASELDAKSAERTAERIVGTNPRSATAWAALGLAQFRLNKSDDASRSLKRAFEIDPRSLKPSPQWFGFSSVAARLAKLTRCEKSFSKVSIATPSLLSGLKNSNWR